MAKYDREIFVQYLQDLCAAYIAENIIQNQIIKLRDLKEKCAVDDPDEPVPHKSGIFSGFALPVILGLLAAGGYIACVYMGEKLSAYGDILKYGKPALLGAVVICFACFFFVFASRKKRFEAYENKKRAYENQCRENEKIRSKMQLITKRLQRADVEMQKVAELKERLYDANIIPGPYRNMIATFYLYEFFAKSRGEDLSLALYMYVLERNNPYLRTIVETQAKPIFGKMIAMAKQMQEAYRREKYSMEMKRKLGVLDSAVFDLQAHKDMVAADGEAIDYFALSNYYA